MTCWAVIPAKPFKDSKSRLSGALDSAGRERLVEAMLRHVIAAAEGAGPIARTILAGSPGAGFSVGLPMLDDPAAGLNPALQSALDHVAGAGIDRILVVAGDLPQLTSHDLALLALAPAGIVAIAPDRHETGTNALSLPLPAARGFSFAFGADSFARHKTEAERLGLRVEIVHSPGLARDIDEPGDLPDAAGLLKPPD